MKKLEVYEYKYGVSGRGGLRGSREPIVFVDVGTLASKVAAFATGKPLRVRQVLFTLAGAIAEGMDQEAALAEICRDFAKRRLE